MGNRPSGNGNPSMSAIACTNGYSMAYDQEQLTHGDGSLGNAGGLVLMDPEAYWQGAVEGSYDKMTGKEYNVSEACKKYSE